MPSTPLRLLGAGLDRPDERRLPEDQRVGDAPCLRLIGARDRIQTVRLTDDEALNVIAELSAALIARRRTTEV